MIDTLVNNLMLPILKLFYGLTGSYGWAILCLTLVIKLALMPLTVAQFKSMLGMQKLAPRLKELQDRYKGKPEELNKRVMALYQENKVNPFGGCLPLIIQLPFLFALYQTLVGPAFGKMLQEGGHPGWFFITDLSHIGAYQAGVIHWDILAMIIFFGLTTWWSQKTTMTQAPTDPVQKQMMTMMPIMITFTFVVVPVPAGVLLYIVFSNVLTIAQNYVMKKAFDKDKPTGSTPATTGNS